MKVLLQNGRRAASKPSGPVHPLAGGTLPFDTPLVNTLDPPPACSRISPVDMSAFGVRSADFELRQVLRQSETSFIKLLDGVSTVCKDYAFVILPGWVVSAQSMPRWYLAWFPTAVRLALSALPIPTRQFSALLRPHLFCGALRGLICAPYATTSRCNGPLFRFLIVAIKVRHGKLSPESDQMIKKLMQTKFLDDGVKATKLYATNKDVDAINDRELGKLPGETFRWGSPCHLYTLLYFFGCICTGA